MGKLLVGDIVKHQLPVAVEEAFYQETGLTEGAILEKVYRQPFPNRFLASLVPFLKAHIEEPSVCRLVERSFEAFFVRNIAAYRVYNLSEKGCQCNHAAVRRDIVFGKMLPISSLYAEPQRLPITSVEYLHTQKLSGIRQINF